MYRNVYTFESSLIYVFLINRLHYVPGYHNPDATMGKEVYRVDDTFSEEERQLRRHQREKYIARPRTAAVDQYKEPWAPLTEAVGPVEAWGAQAWLKTADDDHQHEVVNAIRDYRDKELFSVSKMFQYNSSYQKISQEPRKNPVSQGHGAEKHVNESNRSPKQSGGSNIKTNNGIKETPLNCVTKQETGGQKKLKDIAVKFCLTKGSTKQVKETNVEALKQKMQMSNNVPKAESKKKAFHLKVTTTDSDLTNEAEVDTIIKNVNNKLNQQGNMETESFSIQQKVEFKTPVQENDTKLRNVRHQIAGKDEKEDSKNIDKEATKKTENSKVLIQRQSPMPPPVADASPRPHTAIPSMHRWMKKAGAKEAEQVRSLLYGGYPPSTIQTLGNLGYPSTTCLRRQEEIDNVRKGKYLNKYPRGDFLIHPEYPPSFPHHRID